MMIKTTLLSFILLTLSCESADDRNNLVKDARPNIVVIGNSITNYPPTANIGWYNDWGMAASSPEKDFCGILSQQNHVQKLRVPYWESLFEDADFPPAPTQQTDVLVIQLGENVHPKNFSRYERVLPELIERYSQNDTRVMLISNFWENPAKDSLEKKICIKHGYEFIDISGIHGNISYEAIGVFQNDAVSAHPNDKGMKFIADKIQERLNDR